MPRGRALHARPRARPRDVARSNAAERSQLRKKLHRGGAVLLTDWVTVGGEAERREHLVAQVAQTLALTAIRGHGARADGGGRGMRRTLVRAHRLVDLVVKVVLDPMLWPSWS